MTKPILFLVFAAALWADTGYDVYKKQCAQCHIELISKAETLKRFRELKAPPMVEVSNRIKENVIIKDDDDDVKRRVVIAFIKDYVRNPSLEYSMCDPMAIERFGIMPSQKGKLTDAQIDAVAEWVYDRYEEVGFQ
jgi:hypothetical protein